jgi:membrane-bound ClpP family serine protease
VSDQAYLIWGLALLAVGVLLIIVEVFIPSAGVIAFAAAACSLAGIVSLFMYDATWGVIGILSVLVMGPAAFGFAMKVWPSTPMGRRMMGAKSPEELEADRLAAEEERKRWLSLQGAEGVALTDLRPVGVVRIDGRRYDALAETTMITKGQKVKVTVLEDNQIKVRAIA